MMNIFRRIFERREIVRAASKEQKQEWLKKEALHKKLAAELGLEWKAVK